MVCQMPTAVFLLRLDFVSTNVRIFVAGDKACSRYGLYLAIPVPHGRKTLLDPRKQENELT